MYCPWYRFWYLLLNTIKWNWYRILEREIYKILQKKIYETLERKVWVKLHNPSYNFVNKLLGTEKHIRSVDEISYCLSVRIVEKLQRWSNQICFFTKFDQMFFTGQHRSTHIVPVSDFLKITWYTEMKHQLLMEPCKESLKEQYGSDCFTFDQNSQKTQKSKTQIILY